MAKYLVSAIVVMSFSLSILGAPQGVEPNLLRYSYDTNEGDEGYKFNYELDNGHIFSETGSLKNISPEEPPAIVKTGEYSFVGSDGKTYRIVYTADENGYRPKISVSSGISSGALLRKGISPDTLTRLIG